jgi:hypothetical protein
MFLLTSPVISISFKPTAIILKLTLNFLFYIQYLLPTWMTDTKRQLVSTVVGQTWRSKSPEYSLTFLKSIMKLSSVEHICPNFRLNKHDSANPTDLAYLELHLPNQNTSLKHAAQCTQYLSFTRETPHMAVPNSTPSAIRHATHDPARLQVPFAHHTSCQTLDKP